MQEFFVRCVALLRSVRGEAVGDYLEFGVFNGGSISNMHAVKKRLDVRSMRMFGFDAFEGLPGGVEGQDAGVFKGGFYACPFPKLEQCLMRKGIDPTEITWVKGWYDTTLTPQTAAQHAIDPGIVFVDCDTYSSSKSVLDFVVPLLRKPTIISFDDWRLYDLDLKGEGEYRAFNEFLEAHPDFDTIEIPSYKRNSRTFLVRPT